MRLPRMTTRRWMIAVAIVGVFLTTARLVFFWRHYRALTVMHASQEASYVRQAQGYEQQTGLVRPASHHSVRVRIRRG